MQLEVQTMSGKTQESHGEVKAKAKRARRRKA